MAIPLDAATVFAAIGILGVILTLVAFGYAVRIGRLTGWFAAWYIIAAAFGLAVLRQAFSAYVAYQGNPELLVQANSVLQLILGVLFALGFGLLYKQLKGAEHIPPHRPPR